MALYYAAGDGRQELGSNELVDAVTTVLDRLCPRRRVLAVPPDFTRANSYAGPITRAVYEYYGDALTDVMPALGTHDPMTVKQWERMYAGVPRSLGRIHRWRDDVVDVGTVPAEFVRQVTDGAYDKPWPAQMNRLLWEGGHDLILSIGQIVPHEVVGMANYTKNIFVGTGGARGINESHFIGAVYGMERMMGRPDTPLRRILNYAHETFCSHLPIVFILTVVGRNDEGRLCLRGLFAGDDAECYRRAADLSARLNVSLLEEEPRRMVVYLDPDEFQSTWLGNKAIYRTRMAIADDGELIVIAPGVDRFGEDPDIDRLIRRYGYRTTPEIMTFVREQSDLRDNLSAAAHLIHGSSENRFSITYAAGGLNREEIEGVGYRAGQLTELLQRYDIESLNDGWHTDRDDRRFYYISNPALGLWAARSRFEQAGVH